MKYTLKHTEGNIDRSIDLVWEEDSGNIYHISWIDISIRRVGYGAIEHPYAINKNISSNRELLLLVEFLNLIK